jgi:lysyl-tRNA synthetase class 1
VIPRAVDDTLDLERQYRALDDAAKRLENPVWHIHAGAPPEESYPVSFALLLNLVSASNAHDRDVLWGFIRTYAPGADPVTNPGLDRLVAHALRYYEDRVKPQKQYRAADDRERAALEELANALEQMPDERDGETVQAVVYEIGKRHKFEPLRDWFRALYEVLFGQAQGPRFGSFAALFGCGSTAALIRRALAGEFAGCA